MDPITGVTITTIEAAIEQSRLDAILMAGQINAARTAGYQDVMTLFLARLAAMQAAPTDAPKVPVSVAAISYTEPTSGRVFWTWTDTNTPVCDAIPLPNANVVELSAQAKIGGPIPDRPGCWYKDDLTTSTALVLGISEDGVSGWWKPHFVMAALGYYTLDRKIGA